VALRLYDTAIISKCVPNMFQTDAPFVTPRPCSAASYLYLPPSNSLSQSVGILGYTVEIFVCRSFGDSSAKLQLYKWFGISAKQSDVEQNNQKWHRRSMAVRGQKQEPPRPAAAAGYVTNILKRERKKTGFNLSLFCTAIAFHWLLYYTSLKMN